MTEARPLFMMPPMPRLIAVFSLLCSLAVLAGCSVIDDVTTTSARPLSFTQYQPIYMAVSSIEIIEEYKSPMHPPYVEHLIPYSPAEAIRIWVRDRLRTTGSSRTMQVIIHDGSVRATTLGNPSTVSKYVSWLPTRSDKRYDAKLEVEMRIYDRGVISEASIFVTSTRSITLPDGAGAATRSNAFHKMIGDMMEGFNAEMEKNMFMYMANYISYSQNP